MSRSEKRTAGWPICRSKYYKNQANRKVRQTGILDVTNGAHYKRFYCRYNIVDWKFVFITKQDYGYFFRYSNVDELYKIWRK